MAGAALDYPAGDIQARGYLVAPDSEGHRPGVLVCHEGPGLDGHARMRAEMLAGLGYVALAVDLHGDGHVAASHEEVIERVMALHADRVRLRGRVWGALEALQAHPRVDSARLAAIGYCFGGLAALELARSGAPIRAVVTFHGLLDASDPAEARNIAASVLACTGAADHLVPDGQVADFEREMTDGGVDWQVIRFGGARHAFTNQIEGQRLEHLGFGYDAAADRRAWTAMRSHLAEAFAAPGAAPV